MARQVAGLVVGGLVVLLGGCGTDSACSPGAIEACVGASGCRGVHACHTEGDAWSLCACAGEVTFTEATGQASNPCLVNNGGCDVRALCTPVRGGRTCTCPVAAAGGRTCHDESPRGEGDSSSRR